MDLAQIVALTDRIRESFKSNGRHPVPKEADQACERLAEEIVRGFKSNLYWKKKFVK